MTEYEKTKEKLLNCRECHTEVAAFESAVEAQVIERFRQVLFAAGYAHDSNWPTMYKMVKE